MYKMNVGQETSSEMTEMSEYYETNIYFSWKTVLLLNTHTKGTFFDKQSNVPITRMKKLCSG